MGEEAKVAAAVKRTQDTLGKFLKKPPLTEKLLKKPPFRFLHDIVSAVIKQHGLMEGLFTADELISDNVKDKELKVIFLQKVIDTIKLVTGANVGVKPSKIVAGQEAEKTNELLQCIAQALERKLDSGKAVQEVLSKGNKVTNGDAKTTKTRHKKESTGGVNGKSPPRKREVSKEEKQRAEKPRHRDVQKISGEAKSMSPKKPKELEKSKEKKKAPVVAEVPPILQAEEPVVDNFTPSAPEPSPKDETPPSPPHSKETTPKKRASAASSRDVVEDGLLDQAMPVFGQNETTSPSRNQEKMEPAGGSVVLLPRPASARPTSAKPRPLTARPAAPRLKERIVKPAVEEPEQNSRPNESGEATFVPRKDDEEDAAFIVKEAPAEPQESVAENAMSATEIAAIAESEQPHGHLVSQILGTKRELEPSKEEHAFLDTEGQWQGRESVRQETGKLREGLQGVVRAVNPLARLLDFLQEDIESMQLELDQWCTNRDKVKSNLFAEKRLTEETLAPLEAQLAELDKKMEQQEQINTVLRTNILMNDQKMWHRLSH